MKLLAESIIAFSKGIEESNRPEDRKVASDYLSYLAPLLAKSIVGEDIFRDLSSIERLFGNTWLTNQKPFEKAFDKWRAFKEQYETMSLSAMSVNERLVALDLSEEFDRACKEKNEKEIREILKTARVDDESMESILLKYL
jgi:hypothetical protein